ncbi:MAG: flagellar motor switch protein FliN [bacterium]|jgi:flagellar motor switch protein FliN/FliY
MSEKDLSELKSKDETASAAQEGQSLPEQSGSTQPAKSESAPEQEDDNISWEDAFKEEEAANAAAKIETSGQNTAGNIDIDITSIKESIAGKAPETADADLDAAAGAGEAPTAVKPAKKPVKKLEFASFDESDKTAEPPKNLDFILDIPLTISVELGRTKMVINDMLQLGQGSVIELAKLAGEPLDIYVNGKLMARGEVVLVNDKFGVRLTDIISPVDRVKKL